MPTDKFLIYTDAGSRNNKHSSCSYIIMSPENVILHTNTIYLGENTNNFCEYSAIIYALVSSLAGNLKSNIIVYSDSQLVINQINGIYQVKSPNLSSLHATVTHLITKFDKIEFNWVPRENPMISICDKNCDLCIESYM